MRRAPPDEPATSPFPTAPLQTVRATFEAHGSPLTSEAGSVVLPRVDAPVTGHADHQGLPPACDHDPLPGGHRPPTGLVEVREFADVVGL